MKDPFLPNTVGQNGEKPHTGGLNDTAIPHVKIKITEIPLEKKFNTVSPHVPLNFRLLHDLEIVCLTTPGGVLDISLGEEVRSGPSYPDPV